MSILNAESGPTLASRISRLCCPCGPVVSRRGFLGGMAAAGAAALLPGCAAPGSTAAPTVLGNRDRIDTHHHFFAPSVLAEMKSRNLAEAPGLNWSLARTLDDMDRAGTATAVLSATTSQGNFADATVGKRLARENNEYAARLRSDHKGRFGSFAALPMYNADDALREMEYALDVLKADGIALLTSYGDKWLGHPSFAPVMDELNRRKAILYTHPTLANCCRNLVPDTAPTVVEYGTDTTRTIVNIVFSGTAARCPDLRFIFSHAGGSLPFLTERLQKMPVLNKSLAARVPNGVMHELQRFYYDTAWTANGYVLPSLLHLVPKEQVLFGSDFPYRTSEDNIKGLIAYGFPQGDLNQITRGNALRLMPQLRSA
ncbi:MAG TPA: amidohydrolase family protein [Burkholderiales bacterium]|jgi:predicted TIM-barrel fold metal-dependent hydrolase|nr:amidohydrolase family protein [Burkholderiales bacterium]